MSRGKCEMSGNRETIIPVIPAISDPSDSTVVGSVLGAVKELLEVREGQRGNRQDRFVRVRDLNNQEFVTSLTANFGSTSGTGSGAGTGGSGTTPGTGSDKEPPDPPTSLVVTAMGFFNRLTWKNPPNADLSHIEVWCSTGTQSRSAAVRVGIVTAPLECFDHFFDDATADYYYWIRAVDFSGNYSTWEPPDSQGGYYAPGDESYQEFIRRILGSLVGNIAENHLYKSLNKRIDKIEVLESGVSVLNETVDNHYSQYQVTAALVGQHTTSIAQVTQRVTENEADITQIAQLQDTDHNRIASAEQTLSVHQDALGDLTAQYMIKLDVNGYVSGFGLYNTGVTSDAIFLVDRFMIVTPGKTPKVPFAVGTVNGVSTVGINGQLVIDGSITALSIGADEINGTHIGANTIDGDHIIAKALDATHINVDSLSELSPNLGIVVSGILRGETRPTYNYLNLNAGDGESFLRCGDQLYGAYVTPGGSFGFGDFDGGSAKRSIAYTRSGGLVLHGDMVATGNIQARGVTNPVYWGINFNPWYEMSTTETRNLAYKTLSGKIANSTIMVFGEAKWWVEPPQEPTDGLLAGVEFYLYRGSTLLTSWREYVSGRDGYSGWELPTERMKMVTDDGTSGDITYYLKARSMHGQPKIVSASITIIEFRR